MAKNIVICCDGTGNQIDTHLSNVLKLYRMLPENKEQIRYYDPGVGTLSDNLNWLPQLASAKRVFGLATGKGINQNILDAYCFLMNTYEEGDRVYLFGFSRGAYTVRAIAGLIYQAGLLQPEQTNIADYALNAYRVSNFRKEQDSAFNQWRFSRVTGSRRVPIHFMGMWDTVSSILVPNPGANTYFTRHNLPFTEFNPAVKNVRHAAAIDERRRMFRLHRWTKGQVYRPNPFNGEDEDQNFKETWFAGVHSDIGGGYPEKESALAKIPLDWMVNEATTLGLQIDDFLYRRLVLGHERKGSSREYVKPDANGKMHQSLQGLWKVLEYLPKRERWLKWQDRSTFAGWYLPQAEPRYIEPGAVIHDSVQQRMAGKPTYTPVNLP